MREISRRVVARVEQLLLLGIMVCVTMTTAVEASEAAPPIAMTGCESKCGNVSIPFPFGMGSKDCYLNKWFEIECNNISHTPVLKLSQLEVLNISFGNYNSDPELEVRSPISFMNCGGNKKNSSKLVDLKRSPFVFSSTMNTFMAVSCGTETVIDASSKATFPQQISIVKIGCSSACSSSLQNSSRRSRRSYCDGIDCCQSNLPSELKAFKIDFQISAEDPGQCKYAFVVDKNWFGNHSRNNYVSIRDMDSVPVVLNWYLDPSYFHKFQLEPDCFTDGHCCDKNYLSTDSLKWDRFYCYCYHGFQGNAYLKGCKDINECDENPTICETQSWRGGGTCVNFAGHFECRSRNLKSVFIGVGSGLGALVLAVITWCLFKFVKKRKAIKRREKFFKQNGGLLLQQEISSGKTNVDKTKVFNSKELEKATENFNIDRVLGQGGQGTVYKGMLTDGKIVAVKKSKIADQTNVAEFINEVVILSQINHRNVVKLLGCCLETQVPLLVYEFIPNGTLSQYIHEQNEEFPFTWEIRVRVAKEVAGALSYLHSSASFPIYHRDIKSSNILLDEKYRARVADFGTSRTISQDQTHLTTLVYGTFGYLDPEYFQSSQFTEKSDVYSFGVVLVELLTGQKAVSITRSAEEGRSLATYFIIIMEEDRLFEILDAQVMRGPKEEIVVVANLAKRCLDLSGRNRPTMKEVAMELEGIHNLERASAKELQNCEEVEYVRTELIEPWDVASTSSGSDLHNDGRASLLQELPLLSFKSC